MRRLLLIAPLFLALFLVACDKDKKENPDPNPQLSEKDKILINYPWRMSDVTDLNGKLVERVNTADQTHTLQTARYSKGLYIIKVVTEGNTSTHKLVVQ